MDQHQRYTMSTATRKVNIVTLPIELPSENRLPTRRREEEEEEGGRRRGGGDVDDDDDDDNYTHSPQEVEFDSTSGNLRDHHVPQFISSTTLTGDNINYNVNDENSEDDELYSQGSSAATVPQSNRNKRKLISLYPEDSPSSFGYRRRGSSNNNNANKADEESRAKMRRSPMQRLANSSTSSSLSGQQKRHINGMDESDRQIDEISTYTIASPDGRLYSQTEYAELAFPNDTIDGQFIQDLKSMMGKWGIDEDVRMKTIKTIQGVAKFSRLSPQEIVTMLHKKLKNEFESSGGRYGPEWQREQIMRLYKVEDHPYFKISQLVDNKVKGARFTSYIRNIASSMYLPFLKAKIADKSNDLLKLKNFVQFRQGIENVAKDELKEYDNMTDDIFQVSFKSSGINITNAMSVVDKYLRTVGAVQLDLKIDMVAKHNGALPARDTLVYVIENGNPPWDIIASTFQPSSGKNGKKFVSSYLEDLAALGISIEPYMNEILTQAASALMYGPLSFEADENVLAGIDRQSGSRTNLAIQRMFRDYIAKDLRHDGRESIARYNGFLDLNPYLYTNSFEKNQSIPIETVLAVVKERGAPLIDNPNGPFGIPIAPYVPAALVDRDNIDGNLSYFNSAVFNVDTEFPSNSTTKTFAESLQIVYKDLHRNLLNYIAGTWRSVELDLVFRKKDARLKTTSFIERVADAMISYYEDNSIEQLPPLPPSTMTVRPKRSFIVIPPKGSSNTVSPASAATATQPQMSDAPSPKVSSLSSSPPPQPQPQPSSQGADLPSSIENLQMPLPLGRRITYYIRLFANSIKTGKKLEELADILDVLRLRLYSDADKQSTTTKSSRVVDFFNDDTQFISLGIIRKKLLNNLRTEGRVLKLADRVRMTFPLQYHVDIRFTMLYVIILYEYVRRGLELMVLFSRDILLSQVNRANKKQVAAEKEYTKKEAEAAIETDSVSFFQWSTLDVNSGIIKLDPQLASAINSAWSWIQEKANSVPWDDLDGKLAPIDVINDAYGLEMFEFLGDVIAMKLSSGNVHNTTTGPNTSSAPQFKQSINYEAELLQKAIKIRAVRISGTDRVKLIFRPLNRTAVRSRIMW